jgi:hypothetical protein
MEDSQGRECEFLSYWSTRATISNRTGLIAEFLSEVDQQRWIQWSSDEDSTTFYNIGLWRDAAHFEEQVGRFIDLDRPQLEFEAAKRRRVFLAPARWRVGGTGDCRSPTRLGCVKACSGIMDAPE